MIFYAFIDSPLPALHGDMMPWKCPPIVTVLLLIMSLSACSKAPKPVDSPDPPPDSNIAPNVQALIDAALADPYAYEKLGELCDEIGHRLPASPGMKAAIAWSQLSMYQAGFDSVWTEPVTIPHWTRGNEWARCLAPSGTVHGDVEAEFCEDARSGKELAGVPPKSASFTRRPCYRRARG